MGSTITEKILARAAGLEKTEPGEIVNARLDAVIAHDISGTAAFRELEKMKVPGVFDRERIFITADHFVPSPTLEAAAQLRELGQFIDRYGIANWFEPGRGGICHALFPEQGLIRPGETVVGGDSHTCTYGALGTFATGLGVTDIAAAMALGEIWLKVPASMKFVFDGTLGKRVTAKDLILHTIGQISVDGALYRAMEFAGEAVRSLSMDGRFTLCNMAIEAGAKSGIIEADDVTIDYLKERTRESYSIFRSDADASYERQYRWDASRIRPLVALPHSPANTAAASDVKDVRIDQAVIGSCTNGRMDDLRAAAEILKGRKVARGVRLLIFPATQSISLQAAREGLLEIFLEAGATVAPPICGPCLGGHMGVLAEGETAVSTTNRNFAGRMGHKNSRVYLASPYTAAASAVAGRITDPTEVN